MRSSQPPFIPQAVAGWTCYAAVCCCALANPRGVRCPMSQAIGAAGHWRRNLAQACKFRAGLFVFSGSSTAFNVWFCFFGAAHQSRQQVEKQISLHVPGIGIQLPVFHLMLTSTSLSESADSADQRLIKVKASREKGNNNEVPSSGVQHACTPNGLLSARQICTPWHRGSTRI